MNYDMEKCGLRIKQLRIKNKITQEQLADRLNITLSMLGKIERGQRGISIDLLIEIAQYFQTSLDFIVLGKEQQSDFIKGELNSVISKLIHIEQSI